MTMQAVIGIAPDWDGAQIWYVALACGHVVVRKAPLPKFQAFCEVCRPALHLDGDVRS